MALLCLIGWHGHGMADSLLVHELMILSGLHSFVTFAADTLGNVPRHDNDLHIFSLHPSATCKKIRVFWVWSTSMDLFMDFPRCSMTLCL